MASSLVPGLYHSLATPSTPPAGDAPIYISLIVVVPLLPIVVDHVAEVKEERGRRRRFFRRGPASSHRDRELARRLLDAAGVPDGALRRRLPGRSLPAAPQIDPPNLMARAGFFRPMLPHCPGSFTEPMGG